MQHGIFFCLFFWSNAVQHGNSTILLQIIRSIKEMKIHLKGDVSLRA